jgi:chromate transporter
MVKLLELAWIFFKLGALCFGGGLVIVPMVETEVVTHYGWLTQREFLDAVTLGQITPGPLIISATFIGYKVCGLLGAFVATISVIFPSFVMISLATAGIKKFRENRVLHNFLRGARAAVIAMVFEAALSIGKASVIDIRTLIIAVISLVVLYRYKVNPAWVLLGAGIIGIVS